MNKAELIAAMANASDISKAQAQMAFDSMINQISGALENGDKVTLVNFGTFSVQDRAERTGRNPRTNETITIPGKRVAKFKPGKVLTDNLNK